MRNGLKCCFLHCERPAAYKMTMAPGVAPMPICQVHLRRREVGKWKAGEHMRPAPGEYTRIEESK